MVPECPYSALVAGFLSPLFHAWASDAACSQAEPCPAERAGDRGVLDDSCHRQHGEGAARRLPEHSAVGLSAGGCPGEGRQGGNAALCSHCTHLQRCIRRAAGAPPPHALRPKVSCWLCCPHLIQQSEAHNQFPLQKKLCKSPAMTLWVCPACEHKLSAACLLHHVLLPPLPLKAVCAWAASWEARHVAPHAGRRCFTTQMSRNRQQTAASSRLHTCA